MLKESQLQNLPEHNYSGNSAKTNEPGLNRGYAVVPDVSIINQGDCLTNRFSGRSWTHTIRMFPGADKETMPVTNPFQHLTFSPLGVGNLHLLM